MMAFMLQQLNILNIKITHLFKLLYLLIRNYTRRSMYLNTNNFKPLPHAPSELAGDWQENQLISNPSASCGQGSNHDQYLGDDSHDNSTLDSTLSKCTKCTTDSQSDFMEDFDLQIDLLQTPQKSSFRQLKKEMKQQKIKRKQSEKNNLNLKNCKNHLIPSIQSLCDQSCSVQKISVGKRVENSLNSSDEKIEIQKSTQVRVDTLCGRKKLHMESIPSTSTNKLPFLSLLELEEVRQLASSSISGGATEKKQNLFHSEQTRILQQDQIQQKYLILNQSQTQNQQRYFIDDLVQEVTMKKCAKYSKKQFIKLNFVQSLINHSERYQLPIETAMPKQDMVKKIHLERRECDIGKKTLLIDLDDTIIFTSNPVNAEDISPQDLTISQSDGKVRKLFLRPYAKQFLIAMSHHYQIIIFTAATRCYAEQIRKILDPRNEIISHLLDRQHCFNPNSKNISGLPYIKDLRRLNRDLRETVLLDNSIYSFWYQINNGIPIVSYNQVKENDEELIKVQSYLMSLVHVHDVRIVNQKYFKLEQYQQHVDAKTLVKELYILNKQHKLNHL